MTRLPARYEITNTAKNLSETEMKMRVRVYVRNELETECVSKKAALSSSKLSQSMRHEMEDKIENTLMWVRKASAQVTINEIKAKLDKIKRFIWVYLTNKKWNAIWKYCVSGADGAMTYP